MSEKWVPREERGRHLALEHAVLRGRLEVTAWCRLLTSILSSFRFTRSILGKIRDDPLNKGLFAR